MGLIFAYLLKVNSDVKLIGAQVRKHK
jgi:hypothetical protein